MKETYLREKEELLNELNTSVNGLSEDSAGKRRMQYGLNELSEGRRKNTILVFLEQYKDFLVIILLGAALISAFLKDIESAAVIFIVVTLNALLGTIQHVKAENSLSSLKALSQPTAKVLRNGSPVEISSKDVTIGDVILLDAGDSVPADGRILDDFSLQINESALTGESIASEKKDITLTEEIGIGDRVNMVYMGSFVTYGRGSFVVTDIGMKTEMGKVAELLKNTSEKKTPLQINLDQFGKKLSVAILVICAVLFLVTIMRGGTPADSFMFAAALAVAAIPEALSSIVTIVLSFGTQKMAKENAIIRQLQAVEGLGSVSIICSDKTGTLTQNKMTVKKYFISSKIKDADSLSADIPEDTKMLQFGVLCSDAIIQSADGEKNEIGDPTEIALLNIAEKYNIHGDAIRSQYTRLEEIPFDSNRKLMSTVCKINGRFYLITKGAVDVLLNRTVTIERETGIFPMTDDDKQLIQQQNKTFSKDALRVLAFAYKEITSYQNISEDSEYDLTFLGLTAMMDPPREESRQAVSDCVNAGIRPIMITGDHIITASAIAKQIGILKTENQAALGSDIDHLSDKELMDFVENKTVYARVSPEHKIRIVRAWQEKGHIVAMTGDGVNDAPALKQADVGVAMGITGSEVAKDAASMVLTDDNFATIVKAIENGRNVYQNIKNSIKFLLSGNTAGLIAVLFTSLMGLPVPFAAVHLLFINLLTDSLPAIALGLEPHSNDVMSEPPRNKKESILTKDFIFDIILEGGILSVTTIAAFYLGLNGSGYAAASTMAFSVLCLSRLIHGFNSKAKHPVLFTKQLFHNRFLWMAFFIGFVLLNSVLFLPSLQPIFEVVPLSIGQLAAIYGLSLSNLLTIQFLKWLRNRHTKKTSKIYKEVYPQF